MYCHPEGQDQSDRAKPILRFCGVYVFDVSQTDGQPLPESARVGGEPQPHLTTIKDQVAERGIMLDYGDLPQGADGVLRGVRISTRTGLEPAAARRTKPHPQPLAPNRS